MNKNFLKFFVISLISIYLVSSPFKITSFASTNDNEIVNTASGTLMIDSTARLTQSAEGGSVTITYAEKNKSVEWVVRPKGGLPFEFIGFINIKKSTGALVKNYPISGYGTTSASGSVSLYNAYGLRSGTTYRAQITGIASNSAGTKFYIQNGVEISFKYQK